MFVRKKPNKSGSISIQIVDKSSGAYRVVQTVGVAVDPEAIEKLLLDAHREIARLQKQKTFAFLSDQDEAVLAFTRTLSNSNIVPIGAQLVFGRLYEKIGFDAIQAPLLKELVLSRIIYPGSKLKLTLNTSDATRTAPSPCSASIASWIPSTADTKSRPSRLLLPTPKRYWVRYMCSFTI